MNKCKELDVKSWRDFVEYGKVDKRGLLKELYGQKKQ
ncbi:hypothetical protein J2Z43_001144 [Clostridioides mangenotii]|uniref:Uncharacterized protein n=1 Tax=Metaclostridioides mangenotii TaxID=1540 RepID=A0ABS4E9Z2_9FIRM|nr:hypothetical protein [Clostridioides mangenotii]